MSCQRVLIALILVSSVAVVLSASPKNVIVGSRQYNDYQVHWEALKKPSKWLQVVEADRTFSADHGERITQVRLLDQDKKGNGATATIRAGGPGSSFVTVHFKSQRGQPIDFIAELYGKN